MTDQSIAREAPHTVEVEIEVNYRRVKVAQHLNGEAIKSAAQVDPTFDLYRVEGDDEVLIENDEDIEVRHGFKFVATPGLEPA